MVEAPAIDELRTALAPVEALRGEQTQLESCVLESFASLETMHNELAEWQRELARQQAELDQRAAAVAGSESTGNSGSAEAALLEHQLLTAREELRQLEDENADQLQAIDDLDRQLVAAQTELRVLRKQTEELTISLETERERSIDEHRLWSSELREMRRLLERQGDTLAWLAGDEQPPEHLEDVRTTPPPASDDAESADSTARAAELRRRASTRRAAHRRPA